MHLVTLPAILVRSNCVILSMSEAQAVIKQDETLLFQSSATHSVASLANEMRSKLPIAPTKQSQTHARTAEGDIVQVTLPEFQYPPFELCVLDALLDYLTATKRRQMDLLKDLTQVLVLTLDGHHTND